MLARKPLSEKTVAENVLKWGTGGLNIDGCRIPTEDDLGRLNKSSATWGTYGNGANSQYGKPVEEQGRFPANVILDEEAAKMLDEQSGNLSPASTQIRKPGHDKEGQLFNLARVSGIKQSYGDKGGASRFFYCAKASKKERGNSKHPTVKPLSLMRYLCRLITPPEGIVLDPFAGSGTTLEAAILEGFNVVGIEKEHDYIPDIRRRIERAQLNTQALDMGLFSFSEEAKS